MSAEPDDLDDDGLATPRTALAWQRTGLTHMATGAACLRLLPGSPFRPVLAMAMIAVGAAISVGSRRLHPDRPHRRSIILVCGATAASALAATGLMFA